MYEFLIRDCDESGYPKISECANCNRIIATTQMNLHNRRCSKNKRRKKIA